MKKVVDDVRLMVKVCDMYYNQNLSQQVIGNTLNLSRPTVSRLLVSAREKGIVQITVSNLESIAHWELERKLEKMYALKEVIIVDSGSTEKEQKEILGSAAGQYLNTTIKDGYTVGVSMGSTLYQVVHHMPEPTAKGVTFVPLIGGMGQLRMDLHSNNLAESLAKIYEGRFVPLHAPARVSSKDVRDEFMKEKSLAETLNIARHLDVAILGIGYPFKNSAITATGYFKENEIENLKKKNVAGDICMQFFDVTGNTSPFEKDNYVIGIDIHNLCTISHSVGIAGGIDKISSIRGALRGHYINTLITDICCAEALASKDNI
ncbi:MAG: sugar-binding transcriptional regulator [Clostridiales bacterium]|nr:sugar-binding transcriptional regulator [Clostridiales bacterium]